MRRGRCVLCREPSGFPSGGGSFVLLVLLAFGPLAATGLARGDTVIETTHVITLQNGARLRGNLSPDTTGDLVVVEYPGVGVLRLPWSRVRELAPQAGEIIFEERSLRPEPPTAAEPEPEEPADVPAEPEVAPELREEIEFYIYELGRQRNRNRVLAERHLKRIGEPALPFLIEIQEHPNEFTRRAVFRIFLETGDDTVLLAAFLALSDPDRFVRETAARVLRKITEQEFRFRSEDTPRRRDRAIERWARYLEEHFKSAMAPDSSS